MPRDLPLGNGRLLITFDHTYSIRDVYFPHVGQENHTAGYTSRFGVWVDGQISWLTNPEWRRVLQYEPETLVTDVTAENPRLNLTLRFHDAIDLEHDILVRRVTVVNQTGYSRQARLFAHFDGHLWGNPDADTAYFVPAERALVHYKGQRYFWFSGCAVGQAGYHAFATGNKGVRGNEGTWKDAEDGILSGNPVAQGSVDSVGAIHVDLPPNGEATAYFWMAAGYRYRDVRELHGMVIKLGPENILERARRYWYHWAAHQKVEFRSLSEQVRRLYRQSLLILRTQIDRDGAITAGNDSDILQFGRDTYSYMWPRDAALVCIALDKAGHHELTQQYFQFASDLITEEGFFLHKYNPDGSAGSSWHPWLAPDGTPQFPIQEDETALVLYALKQHYERCNDIEMIRRIYSEFIVPSAQFLATFREPHTGLPAPSYDLWEERHGIHSFTVSAVWAGLQAAASFARIFGHETLADRCKLAAGEIREAALKHLYHPGWQRFARTIRVRKDGTIEHDPVLDSSLTGIFQFGLLSPADPRVVRTMTAVEARLWCKTTVGGMARYEDDYYHQVSKDIDNVPGNPWFICTLWLADWYIARAVSPTYLTRAQDLIEWVVDHALPSGVLAEQVHPYTKQPLSVSPLTWSHATFVGTVLDYLSKEAQLGRAGWDTFWQG